MKENARSSCEMNLMGVLGEGKKSLEEIRDDGWDKKF
jgi:hypothetical protein